MLQSYTLHVAGFAKAQAEQLRPSYNSLHTTALILAKFQSTQ